MSGPQHIVDIELYESHYFDETTDEIVVILRIDEWEKAVVRLLVSPDGRFFLGSVGRE